VLALASTRASPVRAASPTGEGREKLSVNKSVGNNQTGLERYQAITNKKKQLVQNGGNQQTIKSYENLIAG